MYEQHGVCRIRGRNCLPFANTWVHPSFLLGFVSAHLFSFLCCPIICLYVFIYIINVREYRRGNQQWTIQRSWQHRVHRTIIRCHGWHSSLHFYIDDLSLVLKMHEYFPLNVKQSVIKLYVSNSYMLTKNTINKGINIATNCANCGNINTFIYCIFCQHVRIWYIEFDIDIL
jgi:hypothetical protein